MRIAGSELAIFIQVVFINISPVRFVMFTEMAQNDIGRVRKFFLSGKDIDAFQQNLFILQFLADILAGQFLVNDIVGNPHFEKAVVPADQFVADQVVMIVFNR